MKKPNTPTKTMGQGLGRRAFLLGGAQLAVAGTIAWRMHQLGVQQSDEFRLLADENRINIRLIPPARGSIYDREGQPLAANTRAYNIEMVREQAQDPEKILRRLANLIPLSDEKIEEALAAMAKRRAFVPVTIATGLEWEHIAAVSANAPSLPGVIPRAALTRSYPTSTQDYAHIIGYVGPVSDYDLDRLEDPDPLLLIPRFQIGKTGLEAKLENRLRGKAGIMRIEVNSLGRVMRELDRKASTPGENFQISTIFELQKFCLQRLEGQSASAVVMDCHNGDIVALASAPSYEPLKFVNGISTADWRALNEDPYRPLANKATQGTYPPASTFKMIVALAALQDGVIREDEDVHCGGFIEHKNRRFHCWRSGGHGKQNLREALRQSCDIYFYEVAERVGIERISEVARELGLGVRHDLPLPAVRSGLAPTKEWKMRVHQTEWFSGDTLNAGIGQGFVLASPLQLAIMTARIATGKKIEPRMLHLDNGKVTPTKGLEDLSFNPRHLAAVRSGMYDVVNHRRGTARGSILQGDARMAGKTGTSQVVAITAAERKNGVTKNEDRIWKYRDHALFVGYAPFTNPKYSVSVIVEHGGGGSKAAAPIARDILAKALELGEQGYAPLPSRDQAWDAPDGTPVDPDAGVPT